MALMPVDNALERLLSNAGPLSAETVPIADAAFRVLAEPITARRTQPPFDASAMDGYAVRAADVAAVPARLTVIGEAPAGRGFAGAVGAGEAVRIFTGAPLPAGADAILIQENAERAEDDAITAIETFQPGRHIRRAGLDFAEGDVLLDAGRVIDPAALALAAAANHPALAVVRRPVVAILATGDELVAPGDTPQPDQIVASNSYGVAAMAQSEGATVLDLGIAPDDRAEIAECIQTALSHPADIIVTLGGASVGDHDLVRSVLTGQGMELDFWKIAMRPGKPLMFGRFGEVRVLGLPGNPVSAMICAELFLRPLIASLAGREPIDRSETAVLGADMRGNDERRDYVRARLADKDGQIIATPFGTQDSSMLKTLAAAKALIVREPFAPEAKTGDACRIIRLR